MAATKALNTTPRVYDQGDGSHLNAAVPTNSAGVEINPAAPVLGAGTNLIGKVGIDQTTPGTTNQVTERPVRNGGVLHRNAVASADKLSAPTVGAPADTSADSGSLAQGTQYVATVAAGNRWGSSAPAVEQTVTTAADANAAHTVKFTVAQVSGADYYDVFLKAGASAALWVARVTEADRAAGCIITAVATVTQTGGVAGTVKARVVGTGLASNVNPFVASNAYTPATPTAVNCAGYRRASVLVKLAVTDLRSLPTLQLIPFFANQVSAADWHAGALQALPILIGVGAGLEQEFTLDVDGATGLVILVDAIGGQGAAASIWIELS